MVDDPLIGKVFAGCQITRKIGEGGMGAVYLAEQGSLERHVVLKILHADLVRRDEFVRRFLREARSAAQLQHPAIVQVYDRGEVDGTYYILMEYVEGVSLSALIKSQGKLSVVESVDIVLQAAKGLAAAHRSGIVHRDIKPANIMLTDDLVVKVADFGIAKDLHSEETQITANDYLVGTLPYMSPEQCEGKDLDGRADIYSLGVSFYQMVTGQRPFQGKSTVDLMRQHLYELPISARDRLPGVPAEISAVIDRMLVKNREERYANCEELVKDLERFKTYALSKMEESTSVDLTGEGVGKSPTGANQGLGWLVLGLIGMAGLGLVATNFGWLHFGPASQVKDSETLQIQMDRLWKRFRTQKDQGGFGLALETLSQLEKIEPNSRILEEREQIVDGLTRSGMVLISEGPFTCGTHDGPAEEPAHLLSLPNFWIDAMEVTCEAYQRFVEATGHPAPVGWQEGKMPEGKGDHPVTGVRLSDARAYAHWIGKALPTEQEWEKAARGRDGRQWPWGDQYEEGRAHLAPSVPVDSRPEPSTVAVGSKEGDRTPLGVRDLMGNVREWTDSRYAPYPGASPGRWWFGTEEFVQKGGSFRLLADSRGKYIPRASTRYGALPGQSLEDVGFRCVYRGVAGQDKD